VVLDGVFCEAQEGLLQFTEARSLGVEDSERVVANTRKRVLSLFKRRGLLSEDQFDNLKSWKGNGGFSVNADVRIDAHDRKGAERLLRYCARPPFSGEKLTVLPTMTVESESVKLHYDVSKHTNESVRPIILTVTELFDRLSQLIVPPRRHRHHYHGVLAGNSINN